MQNTKLYKLKLLEKNPQATLLMEIMNVLEDIKPLQEVLSKIDINSLEKIKGEPGKDGKDGINGKDGAPGTPGDDGYTPVKGQDYFTEAEVKTLVARVLALIPDPEVVDTVRLSQDVYDRLLINKAHFFEPAPDIARKLNTLESAIEYKVIKDAPTIDSFVAEITSKGLLDQHIRSRTPQVLKKATQEHGGGGSVFVNGVKTTYSNVNIAQGANTTVVATDDAGTSITTITVTSTGGSSSTWAKETPSGLINSVNVTYTLAHTPIANSLSLIVNGQVYTEGIDYTVSGSTITMTVPLDILFASLPFIAQYMY